MINAKADSGSERIQSTYILFPFPLSKTKEEQKDSKTYSCSPSPMTANFSSSKGLSRSNTPPLPPAFAVGLNMYSSSSFSVARATTLHAGDDDDDCEED